jgi:hypothetical protein
VTGERSSAYLNWRYAAFTTQPYRFFCLHDPDSPRLAGYVAFSTQGDKALIGDVFALNMEETAERLLLECARALRRRGYQSMLAGYAGNPQFEAVFRRTGFLPRVAPDRHLVVFNRRLTPELEKLIGDPANWYMFDGEMDI